MLVRASYIVLNLFINFTIDRQRPNFDRALSTSEQSLHKLSPADVVHSRSSSSASSASQKSTGTLPRMKPRKHFGDITSTPKLSKHAASDVDIQNGRSPRRQHAIGRYLSDDTAHHTLPRKVKAGASKSDAGSARSSRPGSAGSNVSVDDHALAEEHNNMIYDVKALSECLLDLQNMVNVTSNGWINYAKSCITFSQYFVCKFCRQSFLRSGIVRSIFNVSNWRAELYHHIRPTFMSKT